MYRMQLPQEMTVRSDIWKRLPHFGSVRRGNVLFKSMLSGNRPVSVSSEKSDAALLTILMPIRVHGKLPWTFLGLRPPFLRLWQFSCIFPEWTIFPNELICTYWTAKAHKSRKIAKNMSFGHIVILISRKGLSELLPLYKYLSAVSTAARSVIRAESRQFWKRYQAILWNTSGDIS